MSRTGGFSLLKPECHVKTSSGDVDGEGSSSPSSAASGAAALRQFTVVEPQQDAYGENYDHIWSLAKASLPLIAHARTLHSKMDARAAIVELEARFGHFVGGGNGEDRPRFEPGVTEAFFDSVVSTLTAACRGLDAVLTHDGQTHLVRDVYWRTPQGGTVRTSTQFYAHQQAPIVTHIQKDTLGSVGGRWTSVPHAAISASVSAVAKPDIRVSLATERVVSADELPPYVRSVTGVRLKQRKSFWYGPWRYDCSRTWTAPTLADVDARQVNDRPRYEVEVELAAPDHYFNDETSDDMSMALKLIHKLVDFYGAQESTQAKQGRSTFRLDVTS